ncbi:MAG: UDP-N-acetylmuramate dehydrogenase [Candidatus Margulisiibacteriota bacterium]
MRYLRNEQLKKHTSFRIGGPADYFCVPKNIDELRQALEFAKEKGLKVAVLGAGTNLLVLEQGFPGLVIKLSGGLNSIKIKNNRIIAGAGVMLPRLIQALAQKGLGGLEFLVGIPGSVGGAVVMNAGAWGEEIAKYVESVKALDRSGKETTLKKRKLKFSYRKSSLQGNHFIVTEVVLKLRKKKKKHIYKKLKEFLVNRRAGQPLGVPNCGSVFKNPKNDFAGRLIEAAGCKGMRIGDAQVSSKHANFILNLGDAKARDVLKLITAVQRKVKNEFKILLEPEVKIMVKSAT